MLPVLIYMNNLYQFLCQFRISFSSLSIFAISVSDKYIIYLKMKFRCRMVDPNIMRDFTSKITFSYF